MAAVIESPAKAVVDFRIIRSDFRSGAPSCDRFVKSPKFAQDDSQVLVRIDQIRPDFQRQPIGRDSVLGSAQRFEHDSQIGSIFRGERIGLDGPLDQITGVFLLAPFR